MRIARYTAANADEWDSFVKASRNGTFLFLRAYMDYHSDRFADHSLMFYDQKSHLVAVMPCNESGSRLYSHQGLTYGGIVLHCGAHSEDVCRIFEDVQKYMRGNGFTELIYKSVPTIYHRIPSQEEDYYLWRNGAELLECNLSSAVDYGSAEGIQAEYCRRNALTRLFRQGIRLNMEAQLQDFWPVLENNLMDKYGATPVHTLTEMQKLQRALPQYIRCCTAEDTDGTLLAGVILYVTGQTVHVQYSSATADGRRIGAQDFLYLSLVNRYRECPEVRFFDFGTSNEEHGQRLNSTLNRYKEGFGARGVVHRIYRMPVH
ncbi:MAG: GNAT family N-acetyltransferase [Prevotellaceae bacterium]|nr:GNAT family N-acetyltransferase [Prevotellaceae bacterium]